MPPKFQRWKNIMKCYPFEEKRLATYPPPYLINIKYDGDRCWRDPLYNGNSLLLSSEENPFLLIPHIQKAVNNLSFNYKLDGELYDHQLFLDGGHELIHGVASRTVNIHPRVNELKFWIFDIKDEAKSQAERLQLLNSLKEFIKPPLFVAPYWLCNSLDEVKKVYDYVIKERYEGIIIRNLFAPYENNKRSRWIMKFKPKRDDNYKVIGWKEEHTQHGEPKGRIGSIIFSSQEGDEFAVSAGLNDDEKERLWKIRDKLIPENNITGTVYYQHLTNRKIPKGTFDIKVHI